MIPTGRAAVGSLNECGDAATFKSFLIEYGEHIKDISAGEKPSLKMVNIRGPENYLGPNYRTENQKPTATVSTEVAHDNIHILPQTPQLIALLT